MNDANVLEEKRRRRNKKYKAEELIYRARINPERIDVNLRNTPILAAAEAVRQLFAILIERCTANLNEQDLIRICIQAEGLDKPISTNVMAVSELTVEKIVSVLMKCLQSKEEIKLDDDFFIDVITIQRDSGGARYKVSNISLDRLKKTSILSIPFDDLGLCCAKAIVFAIAHLENDKRAINSLRDRRRPALMNKAKKLHEDAGIPMGPCTYAEISRFEDFLNVQIAVISVERKNEVSYLFFLKILNKKSFNL